MVLNVVMDSESDSTNKDWRLLKTNPPIFPTKVLEPKLAGGGEKSPGEVLLYAVLSIPVAGHVCLGRGLATYSPLLPQVHAEAQVADREGRKN